MILVIGGAFQGKLKYVQNRFAVLKYADGATCTLEQLLSEKIIYGFHKFIRRQLKEGKNPSDLPALIKRYNGEAIIICDEVGYGIVPLEAFEREYREAVGRICTQLAKDCKEVHRVLCGCGMVIHQEVGHD